ncbi:glutamate mutase L [Alloactinosynnema sp. L-07]|uniref:glutamate mutase L n=1 Tax=Alloactinosynnema sp. L-07 TaxID=1653480 RepID=UPI001E5E3CEF|nr:glutamate mutase L [Alloactinosynnema sp. L-07]
MIGGKGLSRGPRFRSLVRTVTPDAVLTGVSRLAGVLARDEEEGAVLVVDVGGATTDVYSAVSTVDGERAATVALPADRRTVEGDIGMARPPQVSVCQRNPPV